MLEKIKASEPYIICVCCVKSISLWHGWLCGFKGALGSAQLLLGPAGLSHSPFIPVSSFYLLIPIFQYTRSSESCHQMVTVISRALSSVCDALSCQLSVCSGFSLILNEERFRFDFNKNYTCSVLCMSLVSLSSVVQCL